MVPATADPRGREPLAVKVPEITPLFWVIKLLTTAGGEAVSDYLALRGHVTAGVIETLIFVVAVWCQFRTRRYVAAAYWFLALAIAIFGTGIADAMHLIVGISYGGTTAMWAIVLAVIFWRWFRSEGTLSIHSIITRRRETFYWATVFATFALGTALGDFTASVLHLGYFGSIVLFAVVIMIPLIAWRSFGMDSVLAFWFAYVITRPLGASIADWLGKPRSLSGLAYGEAPVAAAFVIGVVSLVTYLAVTRSDVQAEARYDGLADGEPIPRMATADATGYPTARYSYAPGQYGYAPAGDGRRAGADYGQVTADYGYVSRADGGRNTGSSRASRYEYRRDDDLADYGGGWRPARGGGGRDQPGTGRPDPGRQVPGRQVPGRQGQQPGDSRRGNRGDGYRSDRADSRRRRDAGYWRDADR